MRTLEPPDELSPEHHALVAVFDDLVSAGEEFLDATVALPPDEFREALSASQEIDVFAQRVVDACAALRTRARSLGYRPSLEC